VAGKVILGPVYSEDDSWLCQLEPRRTVPEKREWRLNWGLMRAFARFQGTQRVLPCSRRGGAGDEHVSRLLHPPLHALNSSICALTGSVDMLACKGHAPCVTLHC
jgi:hypothetical protein